jgi:hypothetical protein
MKLYETAKKYHSGHPVSKPLSYYSRYQDFLLHHDLQPKSILEVGTFEGESTKIFSRAFPEAKIVSVDIKMRDIDFSEFKNVYYEKGDQSDPKSLNSIVEEHFNDGIDLVIEDASHIGYLSKITFLEIFPDVVPGGAYFIEDWGTGYWDSWSDGRRMGEKKLLQRDRLSKTSHSSNYNAWLRKKISRVGYKLGLTRMHTHDHGMVGFVKSLVDLTHEDAIRDTQSSPQKYTSRIRVLEFGPGVCMVIKA